MKWSYSLGIRGKVLALSCVLLAIPWIGYRYVGEMENFLRDSQQRAVAGAARAIATAMHDRPSLFLSQIGAAGNLPGPPELTGPIELDGRIEDWSQTPFFARSNADSEFRSDRADLSRFELKLGKFGRHLYALLRVADRELVYDSRPDRGDHLQIMLASPEGTSRRYLVSAAAPGPLRAHLMTSGSELAPEPRIQGIWQENLGGYTLELRVPLAMIAERIVFVIGDVGAGSARPAAPLLKEVASVTLPPSDIELVIRGLAHTTSRIWVVDRNHRVLAQAGSLGSEAGSPGGESASGSNRLALSLMHSVYSLILGKPAAVSDDLAETAHLQGREVEAALSGVATTRWRPTASERVVILCAAHPIWNNDEVMGAVVVEETTEAIQTVRNQALERLFTVTLAVFVLGSATLFLFASRLSARIRRLRDEAEQAIDPHGRVKGGVTPSASSDEIGDLSRSFDGLLDRLRQHTSYLENLASRLSHELRTPIAVVRSSLDNLKAQELPGDARVYMERAGQGLLRLNTILTRMGEASRLEQMLDHAVPERFDLAEVAASCVEGYRLAYPGRNIELARPQGPIWLNGVPDLLAQLLDKLAANAVDFARSDTPIVIELDRDRDVAIVRVLNQGKPLPQEMAGQLFESMVSVRSRKDETGPHLGLGLYIVRLITQFHRGEVVAANREDAEGVLVTVRLPLAP
jgi:two-component system sensor histidine kinase ChvG